MKEPAHPASKSVSPPVLVYGNDHSPWVQAVLLGLYDAGIEHRLVAAPPLAVLRASGVLMPVARVNGEDWIYDSGRILEALGNEAVAPKLAESIGRLFLTCAMTRVDAPWTFWQRFSLVRDKHPNTLRRAFHHVFRAVPVFYFFWLISIGRRGRPAADTDALSGAFAEVQAQLPTNRDFLHGDTPGTADYQLFGLVQMCATLPGRPIDVFLRHADLEALRAWASRMQARFAAHDRLYTAALLEPRSPSRPTATRVEQALFWFGGLACWALAPITIPLVFYYSMRIRQKGFLRGAPRPTGDRRTA